jgi:hypothetical protein
MPKWAGVDAMCGIDEDTVAPETVDDFLAGDNGTLALQKKDQQFHEHALEGNALAFLGASLAAQLEVGAIQLKFGEFVLRLRHTTPELRHKPIALPGAAWVRAFGVNRLGLQVSSPNLYPAVRVIFGHARQDAARSRRSSRRRALLQVPPGGRVDAETVSLDSVTFMGTLHGWVLRPAASPHNWMRAAPVYG